MKLVSMSRPAVSCNEPACKIDEQKKFVAWWETVLKITALKVRVLKSRGLKL